MKIPKAWLHGQKAPFDMSKLDIGHNFAWTIMGLATAGLLAWTAVQVRGCQESKAVGNAKCIAAGGSPYKCCIEFGSKQIDCQSKHLLKKEEQ